MAAVKEELTVAIKLNDQFTAPLREIQKETSNTFDENRQGSFLSGIKASTVALAGMATMAGSRAITCGVNCAALRLVAWRKPMIRRLASPAIVANRKWGPCLV